MARRPNRSPAGAKKRSQKCVRYDNNRGDNFKVYATFGSENSILMMFFYCFIKCYECLARGNRESDGLKKFPELQGVMKNFLPLSALPADFEVRLEAGKKSALAKVASDQAKEAAGMYERNQASVPLNGGRGSGHELENPEGRPPTFSVEQPIGMHFGELNSRSSPMQLHDGTCAKGGGYVDNSLELVPGLTGRERANEGCVNMHELLVFSYAMCVILCRFTKNSMLPSPLGNQLESFGGEIVGASNPSQFCEHEQLPTYMQQILDEFDAEQIFLTNLLCDNIPTNHLDDMQVEEINAAVPVSAGGQVDTRSSLPGNTPEEIPVLPHGISAEVGERSGVGSAAICSHSREVCMDGGNTEPLSDLLESVPRDTGRSRADLDFYEQLPFPDLTPDQW